MNFMHALTPHQQVQVAIDSLARPCASALEKFRVLILKMLAADIAGVQRYQQWSMMPQKHIGTHLPPCKA